LASKPWEIKNENTYFSIWYFNRERSLRLHNANCDDPKRRTDLHHLLCR